MARERAAPRRGRLRRRLGLGPLHGPRRPDRPGRGGLDRARDGGRRDVADRGRVVRAQRDEPRTRPSWRGWPPRSRSRAAAGSSSASGSVGTRGSTRPTGSISRRPPERVARLEEAVAVIRALWTGGPVTRDSPYYPLTRRVRPSRRRTRLRRSSSAARRRPARGWRLGSAMAGRRSRSNFEANLPLYLEALAAAGKRREDQRVIVGFQGEWLADETHRGLAVDRRRRARRGRAGGCRRRRRDRPGADDLRHRRARGGRGPLVAETLLQGIEHDPCWTPCGRVGHTGPMEPATRHATDEVLALERRLWTEADRPETMREVIADGGISVIEPLGAVEKTQAMSMPADAPWTEVVMRDVVVREITPDLVVLAYHGQGRRASGRRAVSREHRLDVRADRRALAARADGASAMAAEGTDRPGADPSRRARRSWHHRRRDHPGTRARRRRAPPGPKPLTHPCVRCGAPVPLDVGLCERCNPLGLRDSSASQVHGTVVIAGAARDHRPRLPGALRGLGSRSVHGRSRERGARWRRAGDHA